MNYQFEDNLCQLIEQIGERYGLYIGTKSISLLQIFLDGYTFRYFEEYKYFFHFKHEFQAFIEKKYNYNGVLSWAKIIRSDNSDELAFDDFYYNYTQFMTETEYGKTISQFRNA